MGCFNFGLTEKALVLANKLTENQDETDGKVTNAVTSITMSSGNPLFLEVTALAVLAWLNDSRFLQNGLAGMKFIIGSCKDGQFGSTMSTVLCLKAILK